MSYGKLRNLVKELNSEVVAGNLTASFLFSSDSILNIGTINTNKILKRDLNNNIVGVGKADIYSGVNRLTLSGVTTDHLTISDACNNASNGDVIFVGPGVYVENFEVPANVRCIGSTGIASDVTVFGTGGNTVTLNSNSNVSFMNLVGATSGTGSVVYFSASSGTAIINTTRILGGNNGGITGVRHEGNSHLSILRSAFADGLGHMGDCIFSSCSNDGSTLIRNIIFAGSGSSAIKIEGQGNFQGSNIQTFHSSSNYNCGLYINSTGKIELQNLLLGGKNVNIITGSYLGPDSDGVYIDIGLSSISGSVYDLYIDPATTGVNTILELVSCVFTQEKFSFPTTFPQSASLLSTFFDKGIQNDPAFRIITELSVGLPEIPVESAFGEGDSNINNMFVFSSNSVGGWTDNTIAAKSANGSTFSLYGSTNSGSTAYMGNDVRKFPGLKIDITTPITGAQGIWEFWNGSSWESFFVLNTKADFPYTSYAQNVFNSAQNEQIRFNRITDSWQTTTVNGQSGYWVRNKLSGAITTDPILQRIKLHTNRTEINKDGALEFFGKAQPIRELIWHKNLDDDLAGSSPTNTTINYTANIDITPIDNTFSATALDGNGGMIEIPDGLNTAFPITFEIYWYPTANGSPSNVELEMKTSEISVGNTIDGTLPETSHSIIEVIGVSDANILKKTTFEIDVKDLVPGEFLAFSYFRDSTAGNVDDDFASSIVIAKTSWRGTYWR